MCILLFFPFFALSKLASNSAIVIVYERNCLLKTFQQLFHAPEPTLLDNMTTFAAKRLE